METDTIFQSEITQEKKKEMDRNAILSLVGTFKVSFDFAETFSPNRNYKYEDRYKNGAVEYIIPLIQEENHISLQHILVINGKMVVKHWRQDWLYENTILWDYQKENTWHKTQISTDKAKGTWTQKVFQVDDSPRYESYGTWVFVDGKTYWEASADAPLPRRQNHRKDYNVLHRNHRIEITNDGWMMDQDNKKIMRSNDEDELIVWEKGFEVLERGDFDIQAGREYWENHQDAWAVIRSAYQELRTTCDQLQFQEKVNNQLMYEWVFDLVKEYPKEKFVREVVEKKIEKIITSFQV